MGRQRPWDPQRPPEGRAGSRDSDSRQAMEASFFDGCMLFLVPGDGISPR